MIGPQSTSINWLMKPISAAYEIYYSAYKTYYPTYKTYQLAYKTYY